MQCINRFSLALALAALMLLGPAHRAAVGQTIVVLPDNQTVAIPVDTTGYQLEFSVEYYGPGYDTIDVTLDCIQVVGTCTSITPNFLRMAPGQMEDVIVSLAAPSAPADGQVVLEAIGDYQETLSDVGTVYVKVRKHYDVRVASRTQGGQYELGSNDHERVYRVENYGLQPDSFTTQCRAGAYIYHCGNKPSPLNTLLAFEDTVLVSDTFDITETGDPPAYTTIGIEAAGTHQQSVDHRDTVQVIESSETQLVNVAPYSFPSYPIVVGTSGHSATYTVENISEDTVHLELVCVRPQVVGACAVKIDGSPAPNPTVIAPGHWEDVELVFSVGDTAGAGAYVTLEARPDGGDQGSDSETDTFNIHRVEISVAAGPSDSGTVGDTIQVPFTLISTSTTSFTFDLSVTMSAGGSASLPIDSVTMPASSDTTVVATVVLSAPTAPDSAALILEATTSYFGGSAEVSDTTWVLVTSPEPFPKVEPSEDSTVILVPQGQTVHDTVTFKVTNIGGASGVFEIECAPSGSAGNCAPLPTLDTLAVDSAVVVTVTFDVSGVAASAVTLHAESAGNVHDSSTVLVLTSVTAPDVNADSAQVPGFLGEARPVQFTVHNTNDTLTRSYGLTCAPACSVASPGAQVEIAGGGTQDVVVTFTPTAQAPTVRLKASDTGFAALVDSAESTVTLPGPVVTPKNGAVVVAPGADTTVTFHITYSGPVDTIRLTALCSGVSGCIAPDSVVLGEGVSEDTVVAFTAGGNGTTGSVRLAAFLHGEPTLADTGSYAITAAALHVDVAGANPGLEEVRGECVRIAAGAGAIECDDYSYVYPFVPIKRMNRTRNLALMYSSAAAYPRKVIGVNITIPPGQVPPDSVFVRLRVAGEAADSTTYPGAVFEAGQPVRVAFEVERYDEAGSRLVPYSVQAKAWFAGDTVPTVSRNGLFIQVDRREEFGRGWWPSGYERLVFPGLGEPEDTLLWIGGDGSARAYAPVDSSGSGVWAGITRGVADTIVTPDSSGAQARYLSLDGTEWGSRSAGAIPNLMGASRMTWAFWLWPNGYSGRIGGVYAPGDPKRVWWFEADDSGTELMTVIFNSAVGEPVFRTTTSDALTDSTWNFVVVQFDGSLTADARLKVWVNGTARTVVKPDWAGSYALPTQLASSNDSPFQWGGISSFTPGFKGLVGETAIIRDTLSAAERSSWYSSGIDFNQASLAAGYRWQGDLTDAGPNGYGLTGTGIDAGDYGTTSGYPTRGAAGVSAYIRKLLGGGEAHFDVTGRHIKTVDRTGDATLFQHGTIPGTVERRLTSISLPTPAGPDTAFKFTYASSTARLQGVDVIDGQGGWITYAVSTSAPNSDGFTIDSIEAPDGLSAKFSHVDWMGILDAVTDHRGALTQVDYEHGTVSEVRVVTTDPDTVAAMTYSAYSVAGVDSAHLADSVSARFDGARGDVGDTIRYYMNGWGGISAVRNAIGAVTRVDREDPAFPALPTRITYPNSRVLEMTYDAVGLPDSLADIAENTAVTRYAWHTTWREPLLIRSPEGVETRFGYDSLGNRTIRGVGPDSVRFHYGAQGLVDSIRSAEARVSRYSYDASGNLQSATTPLGFLTSYLNDDAGRVLEVEMPVVVDSVAGARTDEYLFDHVGRQLRHRSLNTLDGAQAWDSTEYNAVGDRTSVFRLGAAAPAAVHALYGDTVSSTADAVLPPVEWTYDQYGRVKTETSDGTHYKSFVYDLAGNVTRSVTAAGDTVRMTYDALSRMITRVADSRTYAALDAVSGQPQDNPPDWHFPFRASPGGGRVVSGDNASLEYDVMNQLRVAANGSATVWRDYTLRGELKQDSTRILSPDGGSPITAVTGYSYDLDGRVTEVRYPGHTAGTPRTSRYDYGATDGRLASLIDMLDDTVSFEYDGDGRPSVVTYPGPVGDTLRYDGDGRLTHRVVGAFFGDSLIYDPSSRIVEVLQDQGTGLAMAVENAYDGLGHLMRATDLINATEQTERFVFDGLGHSLARWKSPSHLDPDENNPIEASTYGAQHGRLTGQTGTVPREGVRGPYPRGRTLTYELNGDVKTVGAYQQHTDENYAVWPWLTATAEHNYYDAEGRLRYRQQQTAVRSGYPTLTIDHWLGAWEEYRYDALGRRVAVLTLARGLCTTSEVSCYSAERFFVWGGDQLLYEKSRTASDTLTKAGQYGAAYYTHAVDVDRPVGVVIENTSWQRRAFFPHVNWRGLYVMATDSAGGDCGTPGGACYGMLWPGDRQDAFRSVPKDGSVSSWFGSLLSDQQDASGLLYRRNRYYDPATGLFTQEDPIGIAGGLNLYGYANGDPINFSDPFGLKVRFTGDNAEQLEEEWNALRNRAREAMGSDDEALSKAGRLLWTTLDALEADEQTIWIGSNSAARPGGTTAAFRGGELSSLAIGINKQMFGGYSPNGRQEVLAHESGHAFHFLNYPRNLDANNALAVRLNNAFRTVIGCTPQLTSHQPQTICR